MNQTNNLVVPLLLHKSRSISNRSVVKYLSEGTSTIVVIENELRNSAGKQRYNILPMNGTTTSVSSSSKLKETTLKPVDIPARPREIDTQVTADTLSAEDLEIIWSGNLDSTIKDN